MLDTEEEAVGSYVVLDVDKVLETAEVGTFVVVVVLDVDEVGL